MLDQPATLARMGHMKDFDLRLRQGGDDAIAAAAELCQELWREIQELREQLAQAKATPTHTPDVRS